MDTIEHDGSVSTDCIEIGAVGTLGSLEGKEALLSLVKETSIEVIGVGVTEAGLSAASNQCMQDLTLILFTIYSANVLGGGKKICIVNTDNVPNNGDVIRDHVMMNAPSYSDHPSDKEEAFIQFLDNKVSFLNTMVDRITSCRKDEEMVPSCEPLPEKALVICDPGGDLPGWMQDAKVQKKFGVSGFLCLDKLAS